MGCLAVQNFLNAKNRSFAQFIPISISTQQDNTVSANKTSYRAHFFLKTTCVVQQQNNALVMRR